MKLTKTKFSPIQDKLSIYRNRNGDAVMPFNCCWNFIDVLVKLSLTKFGTGNKVKEILSWRDVDTYE